MGKVCIRDDLSAFSSSSDDTSRSGCVAESIRSGLGHMTVMRKIFLRILVGSLGAVRGL